MKKRLYLGMMIVTKTTHYTHGVKQEVISSATVVVAINANEALGIAHNAASERWQGPEYSEHNAVVEEILQSTIRHWRNEGAI